MLRQTGNTVKKKKKLKPKKIACDQTQYSNVLVYFNSLANLIVKQSPVFHTEKCEKLKWKPTLMHHEYL